MIGALLISIVTPLLAIAYVVVFLKEEAPITPPTKSKANPTRFAIQHREGMIASIDVFTTMPEQKQVVAEYARQLLKAASADADFIAGATHQGLPAADQPLHELYFVPDSEAWVAIYAQWKGCGHRTGLNGTEEGKRILHEMSQHTDWAKQILEQPSMSLYQPTLLDATGELCGGEACAAGLGVGPIIDENTTRASFINIFATTPDRQQELLETTYEIMPTARKHEGYLRTALHRSIDGNRVVNYGQYKSYRDISNMYYHLKTIVAFGQVFLRDVTPPIASVWGITIGDYPRLRTYTVDQVIVSPGLDAGERKLCSE